jgi:CubicO group peptidase (beta-lactamase class C family)
MPVRSPQQRFAAPPASATNAARRDLLMCGTEETTTQHRAHDQARARNPQAVGAVAERAAPVAGAATSVAPITPVARRRRGRSFGLTAVGRSALALAMAILVSGIAPANPVAAVTGIVAYHGVSSATHQSKFASLTIQGYRPISMSVYGTTSDPRYAAVWAKRTGPAFRMLYATTKASYLSISNGWSLEGYRPELVSAFGSATSARYAAVWIKDGKSWVPLVGATKADFDGQNAWARQWGWVLHSAALHGTSTTPLYTGVWVKEKGIFGVRSFDPKSYLTQSVAAFKLNGNRPRIISGQVGGRYLMSWMDQRIGGSYVLTDLTTTQYQTEFDAKNALGYYPISLSGTGSGTSTRYSVIFAKRDLPLGRSWHAVGTAYAAMVPFDDYMRAFMSQYGIRAGELSIVKSGKLIYTRGYTWAESDYPQTQTTSLFRIASCSKPITAIAFYSMVDSKLISSATKVQDILKLTTPGINSEPLDSRFSDITLRQLMWHRGGFDRTVSPDPMFQDVAVNDLFGGTLPVTRREIARYMTLRLLDFTPGTKEVYSNFGWSLVGQAMEAKSGKTYETLVRERVLNKLGLARPGIGSSDPAVKLSGEVRYEDGSPSITRSVLNDLRPIVADQYGGWNLRNMDAHGAWVAAAPDLAKILGTFDQATNPLLTNAAESSMLGKYIGTNTAQGWFETDLASPAGGTLSAWWHNGSLDGSACLMFHRNDGLSMVMLFNRQIPGNLGPTQANDLSKIANQVVTWPATDLWNSVGIPKF